MTEVKKDIKEIKEKAQEKVTGGRVPEHKIPTSQRPDGSFYGEQRVCPRCGNPITIDKKTQIITCPKCGLYRSSYRYKAIA